MPSLGFRPHWGTNSDFNFHLGAENTCTFPGGDPWLQENKQVMGGIDAEAEN